MALNTAVARQLAAAALALLSMGALAATQATPKWETSSCEYQDLKRNINLSGKCHQSSSETGKNFVMVLTWPSGHKVSVEYLKSQSGHHVWRLNGAPAVAIEINRKHVRGFTLDLNQFLEWED